MRVRRPTTATSVAALLLAGVLTACAPVPDAETVAIALPSGDGRWDDVAGVLRDGLRDAGYAVDIRVAGDDIPTQVMQVRELLDAGPEALIVAPVDAGSLTSVIDDADPAIEVVAFGVLIRDTDAIDRFVAVDASAAGYPQGVALLQGLGLVDDRGQPAADAPRGPFRMEVFAGSPDDGASVPRLAGSLAALQPYLDRGVLSVGSGETAPGDVSTLRGNGATAASRLTQILRETYGEAWPDAVLAPSDQIARALAGALIDAGAVPGQGFPVITGAGAELRSLAALADGRQYATLLSDPRALAGAAVDAVVASLAMVPPPGSGEVGIDNGATEVPATMVQPVPVRFADIGTVVVASGYWSRERVAEAIAEYAMVAPPPA